MSSPFQDNFNNSTFNQDYITKNNIKSKTKISNPHPINTPEYLNWEGANKTYKSNKNVIYGGNKKSQENYAAYYDNKAGDWKEGSLTEFDEKERKTVIGNRQKVINYMYNNNLNSLEDWDNHEIKDKDVEWHLRKVNLHLQNNPDINLSNMLDYMTIEQYTNFKYALGGYIIEKVFEKGGYQELKGILKSGETDEEFYGTITKYLGVNKENLDKYIRNDLKTRFE